MDLESIDARWIELHRESCPHDGAEVAFDEAAAKGMTPWQCAIASCGSAGRAPTSVQHFVYGDW